MPELSRKDKIAMPDEVYFVRAKSPYGNWVWLDTSSLEDAKTAVDSFVAAAKACDVENYPTPAIYYASKID